MGEQPRACRIHTAERRASTIHTGRPAQHQNSLTILFASVPPSRARLGALCGGGADVAGSLTDIVHNGRMEVTHSWHADSGLASCTVMVGFPSRDGYAGAGVFSHVARMSHPLREQKGRGAVIEWERYEPAPGPLPEEVIVRPEYRKARV